MKENYLKALKKSTLVVLLNPVPFNGQSYQKQKGSGTSNQSLFRLPNKLRKILFRKKFDDVKQFLSYSKNYKPIHDTINYSTLICPFESGKCRKEGKKLQKFEYLENENNFLDETKNIFHSFQRAILWWKK